MTLAQLLPRWALHRSMLILVVSFLGLLASGAASGLTHHVKPPIICTGGGQLCNNPETFDHIFPTAGVALVRFTPGPLTCSDFRIHFFVDGTEKNVTDFVGPGGKTAFVSLGFIGSGIKVTFDMQAEGEVGGCNSGTLGSWDGVAEFEKQ